MDGEKETCDTRGGLYAYSERSKHRTRKRGGAEYAEVSRGHSSGLNKNIQFIGEGPNQQEFQVLLGKGGRAVNAENKESRLQKNSAEHEAYVGAHRSFNRIWKERDSAQPDLLEKILDKDNLNRAYKRVKANKGAPGMDGMTTEMALLYLWENQKVLIERIHKGKYTPNPVRRVEIPKPDGGMRKLGIPTVIDRIIQQAMAQQLIPIYEPEFADGSYGYRPGRSAKDAIRKVKEYAEQGYTYAVVLDLSKYFDTINHTILLNILRRNIRDERVIQMIKRYLKSGVMEGGVVTKTEEGSPQGGLCGAPHNPPYVE